MLRRMLVMLIVVGALAGCGAPKPTGWTPAQVVAAFKAAGLPAENALPLTKEDYGLAPYVGSGLHFFVPTLCADCGGRVFAIENKEERERLQKFYVEMGKQSAVLFSWVFVKDNIVVQINGDLPEAQAKAYDAALSSLR